MSRSSFILTFAVSSLLLMTIFYPIMAGDIPGQGEVAVVGKINVGDVIEVQRDGVPLREGAGTSYTQKRTLNKGETWVVQGGPQSAEGLTWWYISIPPPYQTLDYSSYGWVAEVGKDGLVNIKEKINNNPPSKPTNQEPPNGASGLSLTPTLRASSFSDPDGDSHLRTWWEVIKVSDNTVVWDSGWRNYDLTSTTIPSGILQPNTQYKWRCRYMDSKGAWSSVSDFTTFTTGAELLPAPSLYSPPNQAVNVQVPVTFSWSSVSGANRYWLIISTDPTKLPRDPYATSAPGCKEYYTSSTSYQVSDLDPATTYYWEVQAFYIEGGQVKKQGQYSDIWSFTTASADNPPKVDAFDVNPRSTTLGNSFTISYTVSDDKGLARVELWRADDSGGSPVNWKKISEKAISGTSYSGSFTDAPPSAGSYWYGIHVCDTKGQWVTEPSPIKVTVTAEQELQIIEHFKVTVSQGGSATGYIKIYNPNNRDHKILANSFTITDYAGFKGRIYATNLGSDLRVPANGYATIEIKVEADPDCPVGTYYPKYKITSDV